MPDSTIPDKAAPDAEVREMPAPTVFLHPDASRGTAGGDLPVPRLQLRWALSAEGDPGWGLPLRYLEQGEGGHRRWICHYEFVVPLREHDIRREREGAPDVAELVIPISKTQRGSTHPPDDEPYRDGAHAAWDAPHFGNPPVYVLPVDGPAVLLSDILAQRKAWLEREYARTSPSPGPAGADGAAAGGGAA